MEEINKVIDLKINDINDARELFGNNDQYLNLLEEILKTSITSRGEEVYVSGQKENVDLTETILRHLLRVITQGQTITERDIIYAIDLAKQGKIEQFELLFEEVLMKNFHGKPIRVKTLGQKEYVHAMDRYDMVFSIGPAGTGKTYLSIVKAAHQLKNGQIKKIILTRPAVEAGESLGFLPGDLKEKVDPYLRPLYDALYDVLGRDQTLRLVEKEVIEIAPLAYMRGRTLDDAFIILDEAQNTTPEQMKMFLTRLGFGSKMVITGDVTQIDLPKGISSGLNIAKQLLSSVKGIKFINLTATDVVRHPLVQKIIQAYDQN